MLPSFNQEGRRGRGHVLKREIRPLISLLLEREENLGHASLHKHERRRGLGPLLRWSRGVGMGSS